jgi:hypothetical protein
MLQVTGDLSADPARLVELPDYLRPKVIPRQCCIYLDALTSWPHRIEWWGSAQAGERPRLILQMEFRDPVFNRPLSQERCATEFTLAQGR